MPSEKWLPVAVDSAVSSNGDGWRPKCRPVTGSHEPPVSKHDDTGQDRAPNWRVQLVSGRDRLCRSRHHDDSIRLDHSASEQSN